MKKKFYSFWGVSQLLVGAMTIGLVSCEKSSELLYDFSETINPQMRSPLCMVLENFNEKGFCKYYHEATNMEYLYDPTTKLCFSFFADERDESLLEVYGLSSWASNLVEKQISIATLANLYTIIGL